ncbi:hypothetical protein BGZ83_002601 [Gryganskiella cystojenkinii]|nr:hypothetical protein BGZ83_002601 [Gryganskiella cystojenkinii]
MEPDSAVASNVRDSFPKGNNSSSAEHQDSHDPNKKKDKKKKKRQNKEVVREKKRAKHATDTTRAETFNALRLVREVITTVAVSEELGCAFRSYDNIINFSSRYLGQQHSEDFTQDTHCNLFIFRKLCAPSSITSKRCETAGQTDHNFNVDIDIIDTAYQHCRIQSRHTHSYNINSSNRVGWEFCIPCQGHPGESNGSSDDGDGHHQHYRTQPQQYSTQQQSQHDHHNRATSLSTPEQPLPEGTTVTSTGLIRAKPIMVTLDKHPGRVEFPYGNYPSYYEKRSREQKGTSKTKSTGEETARMPSSRTKSLSSVVMGSGPFGNQDNSVSKSLQGDHQQRQSQHFRTTTPSVLFPAHRSSSSLSLSSSTSSGSNPRTVQELAKSVDLRLEFLEGSWFRGKRVLDIGCNAGLLTVFIAMHYQPHKIEGVDIDPSLIGKAQNFVLKTFSQISRHAYLQEPLMPVPESSSSSFSSSSLESSSGAGAGSGAGTETNSRGVIGNCNSSGEPVVPYQAYFPKALQRMHGSLPIPVKTDKTQNLFPHNIELRIADWANEVDPTSAAGSNRKDTSSLNGSSSPLHDVILGFSLTKWIHLHNGDEGLKLFFKKIYRSLNPGGIFLMEPQAYNTYKKRSKLTKTIEEHYKAIKFMPDQFETFLLSSEVGFREMQHLGQSQGQAQNFNRPIILFRK